MKRTFFFTGIAAIVLAMLSSCNFFSSRKSEQSLDGRWKIDSVNLGPDSGKNNIGNVMLAIAIADSQDIQIEFKKDTVYTLQDGYITEQSPFQFNVDKKEIVITDSTMERYHYNLISDSVVTITDKDQTRLLLKKIQ